MKKENHKMESSDLKEFPPKKIKYIFLNVLLLYSVVQKKIHIQ